MSENGLPLPVSKYATVDLGATAPIRVGLSIQAGLKNVLDRSYYYRDGFPEAGRNWYLRHVDGIVSACAVTQAQST
jgi:outer membrane receptor protein involved in Fe transport